MPFDNWLEILNNKQIRDRSLRKDSLGGIAQPQPTYHDVDSLSCACFDTQSPECDLRDGEMARHQKLVAERDLPDIHAKPQIMTTTQAERAT